MPKAANDDHDASELEVSSLETRFVEREDDGETLWEVVEILDERKNWYKVRWAGFDPATKQPWPLEWVSKVDCTDSLVLAWKRKKAEKKLRAKSRRKSIQSRTSAASTISKGSRGSSSTTVTRTTVPSSKNSKPVTSGTKRKNDERLQSVETITSHNVVPDTVSSGPPKKKRKIAKETLPSSSTPTSELKLRQEEEPSGDEQESIPPAPRPRKRSKKQVLSQESDLGAELPNTKTRPTQGSKLTSSKSWPAAESLPKLHQKSSTSHLGLKRSNRQSTGADDTSTFGQSSKNLDGPSKRPKVADSSSIKNSPLRSHAPKRQDMKSSGVSVGSRPSSSRISAHRSAPSNLSSQRQASSSSHSATPPSPPLPHSPSLTSRRSSARSPSTPTSTKSVDRAMPQNRLAHTNQGTHRDDDDDSGLEYVDYPPLPKTSPQAPPVAQPAPPLFLQSPYSPSPSPPPSPSQTLKGKSQVREPDAVPETEAEQSQDSEPQAGNAAPLLTSSPSKTVVKRMKPRTPGAKKNIPDADIIASPLPLRDSSLSPSMRPKKFLHPIPQVSPSKFSNLPSSMIESADTSDGEESSIEQFESPDKSRRSGTRKKGKGKANEGGYSQEVIPASTDGSGSGNGSLPVPPAARDVVNKGTAMADAVKRAKMNGNGVLSQTKVPLATVIEKEKERAKSRPLDPQQEEEEEEKEDALKKPSLLGVQEEEDEEEEEEGEEEEKSEEEGEDEAEGKDNEEGEKVEKNTSEKGKKREPSTLEEFADSFVNYDAGIGEDQDTSKTEGSSRNVAQKVFSPQEEEESTQDLLMELEQRPMPNVNEGWAHPAQIVEDSQQQLSRDEEMVDVVDSLEVAPKSSAPIVEASQQEPSQLDEPSEPSPKHTPVLPPTSQEIPATISPMSRGQDPLFLSQSQYGPPHLESAMNLLNKKSEEISRLEALLAASQAVVQDRDIEIANLKASSQDERTTFTTSLETAKKRQELTEKDVDFFRDQYLRASAFVSEVQSENRQLLQRVESAEAQASSGVGSVRKMFEVRVKELEDDITYHKLVSTFLIEQSQRTDAEEIRRRAAEYPEIKRKNEEMEGMLDGARETIDLFEKQVTTRDKQLILLNTEKVKVQAEVEELRIEVDKLRESARETKQVNGINPKLVVDGKEAVLESVTGDVQVYRCLWRKSGREQCDAMFVTREDLQRHLETHP